MTVMNLGEMRRSRASEIEIRLVSLSAIEAV